MFTIETKNRIPIFFLSVQMKFSLPTRNWQNEACEAASAAAALKLGGI
jgi:hypothetical protein